MLISRNVSENFVNILYTAIQVFQVLHFSKFKKPLQTRVFSAVKYS
jgi:hypothetical protein